VMPPAGAPEAACAWATGMKRSRGFMDIDDQHG
jgi:hypothetical protein